jgi:FG-GAP-like repeat
MATFTVTNLYDSGTGSLRDALSAANPNDTIDIAPNLAGGTLILTNGQLDITKNLTINGITNADGTPAITIDAGGNSRVFDVDDGTNATITVKLDGLVMENGHVGADNGGAITVGKYDALTLSNSRLTGNSAAYSGGPYGGEGGAIYLADKASLTVLNSTIDHNTADGSGSIHKPVGGGAISAASLADVSLVNSTLSDNSAGFYSGGALYLHGGNLTLTNTTISGSFAFDATISSFFGGAIKLYNSTITGNKADEIGGIVTTGGSLTLSNSIIAGNYGNHNDDISSTVTNIYFRGNNILGSTPVDQSGTIDTSNGSYTTINGRNAGALKTVFASVGYDPSNHILSGVLANNGGPVETTRIALNGIAQDHGVNGALPPDSFDLNNNSNTAEPLPVDARGLPRVYGSAVDIGALESRQGALPTPIVVTTLDDETYDGGTLAAETADGNGLSLREALGVLSAYGATNETITFAPNLAGGTLYLAHGELDITTDGVTIEGDLDHNGTPDIAVDAGYASRVFNIDDGLQPTTIAATLDGLVIADGFSGSNNGGGIAVGQSDVLTLKNSKVAHNYAYSGGGIYGGQASSIALINTSVFGNVSEHVGGGIYVGASANLTLTNTTVSSNDSQSVGGGIDVGFNSTGTLTNATIVGNYSGGDGGGVFGAGLNPLKLYNSTLTGNYTKEQGGGIYSVGGGGANLTLANSIVAGNAAFVSSNDLDLHSPLVLKGHSILGSAPANAVPIDTSNGNYTPIDGTNPADLATVFARVGQNPHTGVLSGTLADNGGPVRTVAINPTGIAHDTGSNLALPPDSFDLNNNSNTAEPLPVDARGFARIYGGTVDVGAFEQQAGATFVVTTLADESYDGGTLAQETADGSGLSLREALALANQDPTTKDTITFDPSLIGGSTHGVNDGVLLLTNGQLIVDGNVAIEGDINGDTTPDITIDGQGASRDFDVLGGNVTLDGLTITGGDAHVHGGGVSLGTGAYAPANVTISHSVITGNQSAYGGGISVNYGDALQLTNSVISGNSALYVGGGIANEGALQMRDVAVSGNSAGYNGGGIASQGALLAVNTTISNNQVTNNIAGPFYVSGGGGLYNSGIAALANTTIADNKGGYAGGGIYNSEQLQLTNVTVANNSATNGGGLYNAPCGCGNVAVYNSTFTGNYAQQIGGGIYNANGMVALTNSVVAGNAAYYRGPDVLNGSGTTNYYGVNLFSQASVGRPGTDITQPDLTQVFANLTTIDPDGVPASGDEFQAGTLANNVGPVPTVAIKVGGSAQDTGSIADLPPDSFDLNNNADTAEPLPVDARGLARVFGAGLDIGAFEAELPVLNNVPPNAAYTEQAAPVELSPAFGNANALTVSDAGAAILTGAVVTISAGAVAGDALAADTTGTSIAASYDSTAKTLTLSGSDTLANYSKVLDSVTFSSTSDNPDNFGANSTRTVTWSVTDGGGATNAPGSTTTINITAINDAPVLSNVAPAAAVSFPGQTIIVAPALSVGDPDDQNLAGATVHITGGKFAADGDTLAATTAGTNILQSYDPGSETLTLSGADTLAAYAQVLDSVTFNSTSANPTNGGANKTRTLTWTANDGNGVNNLSTPATTTISFQQSVPFDLNGDANSDLVFQSNGQPGIWLMNGATPIAEAGLSNPGASWHIITSRDLNGDGNSDLIWQNNDGTPGVWLMNGTTPIAEAGFTNPGASWHIVASGDMNGDGKSDLIWQNTDGTLGVWLMNGTTPTAQAGIGNPGPNWKVVGSADFNGDHNDDILLQNSATGNLMIDVMNGTSIASSVSITVGDPSWHAVSTGEFNGQAEIAWQNNNGTVGVWLMNGTSPAAEAALPNPGTGWQLVSIDHFTPNGQADLLFQNTSGPLMLWEMNGTSVAAMVSPPNPTAAWQSVNGHPFASG